VVLATCQLLSIRNAALVIFIFFLSFLDFVSGDWRRYRKRRVYRGVISVRPSSPVLRRQRERVEAVQSLRSFSAWISIGARLGKKLSVGYGTTPIYQICKVIVDSTLLRFISAGISNELASTRRNGNPKWEHILRMVFLTLAHPARATGGRTYVNS
jgi:hypothetical protein